MYFLVGLLASKKVRKMNPFFLQRISDSQMIFLACILLKEFRSKRVCQRQKNVLNNLRHAMPGITFPDKQMTLVEGFKRLIMATQHQKPASHLLVYAKVLVLVVVDWVQHKKSTLFYHPCGMPHPKDSAQNQDLRLSF